MKRLFALGLSAVVLGGMGGWAWGEESPYVYPVGGPRATTMSPVGAADPAAPVPMGTAGTQAPVLQQCDVCDTCCDTGCGGVIGGIGFYYIKPHWEGNPAFAAELTDDDLSGATLSLSSSVVQGDFSWDYELAPRIWLGFVGADGLGGRVRWWGFDHSPDSITLVNDDDDLLVHSAFPMGFGFVSPGLLLILGPGEDTMVFNSNLETDVWDLEATLEFQPGCWSVLVAAGVRYVDLSQSYSAVRINEVEILGVNILDAEFLSSDHDFQGAGPTVALEVRRPLGCCGLALYGSTRGSLLFGDAEENAHLNSIFAIGEAFSIQALVNAAADHDDVLPIAEIELGVECEHSMGPYHLFVQVALVGQTWFGAGNAANNETITGALFADQAADNHSNLGFFGVTASAGVTY